MAMSKQAQNCGAPYPNEDHRLTPDGMMPEVRVALALSRVFGYELGVPIGTWTKQRGMIGEERQQALLQCQCLYLTADVSE